MRKILRMQQMRQFWDEVCDSFASNVENVAIVRKVVVANVVHRIASLITVVVVVSVI